MLHKLSTLFTWFTYRPKWYLETQLEDLLTRANDILKEAITKAAAHRPAAAEAKAEGHTATANLLRDFKSSLERQHQILSGPWSANAMTANKRMLRAVITDVHKYCEELSTKVFEIDWEAMCAQETALRREIGDKVRNVDHLKADITVLMLQKLGMLTVHDTAPILDFAMIIKDWSDLVSSPRIHTFAGLNEHLHTLTKLGGRMHELKRTLEDLH
ncbi:MAG TPA: hypothetical protein VJ579_02575 [Candidatus Paceibacterota bacterium]|nr:hypothetical protein [Candidatus Paceibacterota bacterium]